MNPSNKSCFVAGDFNINLLGDMATNSQVFVDIITSHSSLPLINKPSRITENSATVIDITCIYNVLSPPNAGIILSDISDHLTVFSIMPRLTPLILFVLDISLLIYKSWRRSPCYWFCLLLQPVTILIKCSLYLSVNPIKCIHYYSFENEKT